MVQLKFGTGLLLLKREINFEVFVIYGALNGKSGFSALNIMIFQ